MVELLALHDLDELWPQVEQAVDRTPGIDPWCSGPDWAIPVAQGFAPDADRLLLATPEQTGFALLTRYETPEGVPLLSGLEPLWGFGSPVIGEPPPALSLIHI